MPVIPENYSRKYLTSSFIHSFIQSVCHQLVSQQTIAEHFPYAKHHSATMGPLTKHNAEKGGKQRGNYKNISCPERLTIKLLAQILCGIKQCDIIKKHHGLEEKTPNLQY